LLQEKSWNNTSVNQEEDFIISSQKRLLLSSQCSPGNGSDIVSIRLQNTLSSQILVGFEHTEAQGMIIMDSSDFKGGLTMKATTSNCAARSVPGNGRNCRVVVVNGRSTQVCR
jgi:hypothetical protein